jgi:hypothetical protein
LNELERVLDQNNGETAQNKSLEKRFLKSVREKHDGPQGPLEEVDPVSFNSRRMNTGESLVTSDVDINQSIR